MELTREHIYITIDVIKREYIYITIYVMKREYINITVYVIKRETPGCFHLLDTMLPC